MLNFAVTLIGTDMYSTTIVVKADNHKEALLKVISERCPLKIFQITITIVSKDSELILK
jgi:hypothetical protein